MQFLANLSFSFSLHSLCSSQALRYPYFRVGQAFTAPPRCSEQQKPGAKTCTTGLESSKPLSLCKMNLELSKPRAGLQPLSPPLHRPLQQISLPQDNMELSSKQTMHWEEGQQEPLSLVKSSWQTVGITPQQLLYVRAGPSRC